MEKARSRGEVVRRNAWWWFLVAGALVDASYFIKSSPVRYLVSAILSAAAAVAILVGVRWHRPRPAVSWYLLAVGTGLFAVADTIFGALQIAGTMVPVPSVADLFYLAGYLLFIAGLIVLGSARSTDRRWIPLLDAGIITLGMATLTWALVVKPYLRSETSALPLTVSLAYPVLDLLLLYMAARLVLTSGVRSPALALFTAWVIATLAADALYYSTLAASGTPVAAEVADGLWNGAYVCLGAAALHPSLADTTRVAPPPGEEKLSPARMWVLILLTLLGPALVVANIGDVREQPLHAAVICGIVAALTLLLMVRIMLLARFAENQADRAKVRARMAEQALQEQTQLQKQLSHQAFHDRLTGLANRTLFSERLEEALGRASTSGNTVLLVIDLDHFKDINDSLGHPVGDELLITVGHRLLGAARRQDTVARMGGDEFAILAEDLRDTPAERYATRFLERFKAPFALSGHRSVFVTASIGIVAINEPMSFKDALRDADIALYVAKNRGRNRAVLFESAMSLAQQNHARIAQELRYALTRNEFAVRYQSVVDLSTTEVVGVEALLRWQQPGRAHTPPELFIPIAEETGLIIPIGAWVLRQACAQGRRWHDTVPARRPLSVAVNVSGRQLKDNRFPETVRQVLSETGFPATSLVLEITESTLVADAETASAHIRALRDLGVRISIDDFGTGYSSLSYLRDLPVDIVKIDQSFVLGGAAVDNSLIQAILHLGYALDLDTIAEGIETPHQAKRLRALGCPYGQGFYYSRPMSPNALEAYLATQAALTLSDTNP
ncbi:putative bifunctional diguanylate cyclase/phosphodiesterase [Streptomyces cavernae]|uniref:putative bifunctional diguanylate cyclase/phosphodiesterase n=1 Tax=Streptomyces cavernae TaxID=2259034 RepID=UPI0013912204|nr:GGDEF domain-containing phosphodiesterase [Streptomyces cavernae]